MTKGRGFKTLSGSAFDGECGVKNSAQFSLEKGNLGDYKLRHKDVKNLFSENRILWTAQDVASFLQCSVKHVYNLVWKGEIPYVKIGGLLRFKTEQLKAWLEERTTL